MGTFGHETLWRLMAGKTEVARVEPDYDVGGVMSAGTVYQHHSSMDDAKRAAEEICGAEPGITAEALEQARAEERERIVAYVRKKAEATQTLEDEFFSLHGSSSSWGELANDLRELASELEAQGAAKAGDRA
jgi:hypothetical protein